MVRHSLVLMSALIGLTSYASAEEAFSSSVLVDPMCSGNCRAACLKAHEDQLSATCREVLRQGGE